jgi:hypothetical protein
MTCTIQWVSDDGKPTPDNNSAIGYVRRVGYREPYATALNGFIEHSTTDWFPICAEHAARLSDHGMQHWEFRAMETKAQELRRLATKVNALHCADSPKYYRAVLELGNARQEAGLCRRCETACEPTTHGFCGVCAEIVLS